MVLLCILRNATMHNNLINLLLRLISFIIGRQFTFFCSRRMFILAFKWLVILFLNCLSCISFQYLTNSNTVHCF